MMLHTWGAWGVSAQGVQTNSVTQTPADPSKNQCASRNRSGCRQVHSAGTAPGRVQGAPALLLSSFALLFGLALTLCSSLPLLCFPLLQDTGAQQAVKPPSMSEMLYLLQPPQHACTAGSTRRWHCPARWCQPPQGSSRGSDCRTLQSQHLAGMTTWTPAKGWGAQNSSLTKTPSSNSRW